ncbi:MAG: M28 family metallopeptidase, partial [Chloroflexota bacterium]
IPATPPASTAQPVAPPTMVATPPSQADAATGETLGQWAYDYVRRLSVELGPRTSGTEREKRAADYIAAELRSLGYQVEIPPFPVQDYSEASRQVVQDAPEPASYRASPIILSGHGAVTAPLAQAGRGRPADFPSNITGKVALMERGVLTFQDKVANAAKAGAAAAIIYNNAPGPFQGSMQSRGAIPAVAVSREDGAHLLENLDRGGVTVTVTVTVQVVESPSQNVIGEKPGGDRVIIVGGHYDTVAASPGANDNGSGTAVMLAVARYFAQRQVPVTLRFMGFGAEEAGLVGSRAYVRSLPEAERKRIVGVLNLDALGTGAPLQMNGSTALSELVQRVADRAGITLRTEIRPTGSSDHASFIQANIPAVHISSSNLSRIHTSNDRIEFVERALLRDAALLAVAAVREMATGPQ